MSQVSTSLELSEFFNNDDSDGNRLAEFLQKRHGRIQKQKFLYINGEPDRLSLNVQLEKLPDLPREATNSEENGKNEDAVSNCENQNNKSTKSNDNSISKLREDQNKQPIQAVPPLATGEPQSPLSIRNLKHHTPLFSSAPKSCEFISPSDRLRRYSMKRLKFASGGRRTLLKEFESTIDKNFDPLLSSTPYSHPQQEKRRSANSGLPLVLQNDRPLPHGSSKDDVCSRKELSVLLNSVQNKTKIIEEDIESNLDKTEKTQNQNVLNENAMAKTKSHTSLIIDGMPSLKHTFTVAEGNLSKGISRDKNTPGRNRSSSARILLELPDEQIGSQKIRASQIRFASLQRLEGLSVHMNSKRDQHQEIESSNLRAEGFPKCNESVVHASKIIGEPETQNMRENSIMVVIPINQTFNRTCLKEIQKNAVEETKTKQHIDNSHTERMQQIVSSNEVDTNRTKDKLQLTDILTEDEETPQSASLSRAENNSEGPINLAAKRLKKRSTLRQAHTSRICNFENETEKSPAKTRSSRRIAKEVHRPLNSAPGFPINGEKFAADLERMSNYEILDLRKRNSKGQIFTISGHKSRRLQDDAVKQQNLLDNQIEKELLKRSMKEVVDKEVAQSENNCEENEINENLPVPDKFSESLTNQQEISNEGTEYLNSGEMVSFKNKGSEKTKKAKNKGVTEELKQYLRVTKSFSKKKRKISNNAKRSLYTPGLSDSEESYRKREKRSIVNESADNLLATRKVVSPTPTLEPKKRQNHQVETNQHEQKSYKTTTTAHNTGDLPISSQGCEINSNVGCNIENSNHPNITTTFLAAKTTTNLVTHEKQDEIFKKPNKPAPKVRRGRNKELENLLSNNSQHCIADERNSCVDSTNDMLRRSKRAHVPVSYPIVEELHQRAINKYLKRLKSNNDFKLKESVYKIKPAKSSKVQKNPLTTNNSRKIKPNENVICDHLLLATPENIGNTNNAFDQMQNSNSTTKIATERPVPPLKIKPFKVRVARLKSVSPTNDNFSSVSSISSDTRKDSSCELISWLKNIKGNDSYTTSNSDFNYMKLSAASDVFFTEAQGLDYAFYDTHENIHLGYLRFKPRQLKPKKRASNSCLRFIALNGNFRVTANNEESRIGVGDMIVIEKSVLYEIENLNEDFGILMVFKN